MHVLVRLFRDRVDDGWRRGVLASNVRVIEPAGKALGRSQAMTRADLAAANETAHRQFHEIMVLAHAHRDLTGDDDEAQP